MTTGVAILIIVVFGILIAFGITLMIYLIQRMRGKETKLFSKWCPTKEELEALKKDNYKKSTSKVNKNKKE